ncbi:hypothetical protein [Aeromonas caviae]|uniref:hypothetical protein n=1 Tax=Aeromonas caviae TaxID=648 RepID=UPI0038D20B41
MPIIDAADLGLPPDSPINLTNNELAQRLTDLLPPSRLSMSCSTLPKIESRHLDDAKIRCCLTLHASPTPAQDRGVFMPAPDKRRQTPF